jgi:hypothetical protein
MSDRRLFVEPLLRDVAPTPDAPDLRYDPLRGLSVLEDGTPAVDSGGLGGWGSTQVETRSFPNDTKPD